MSIAFITPRFYPVVGGAEVYLKNIALYCSNYLKTTVITSNLKSSIKLFEKYRFIKKKFDQLNKNIRIIRIKTLSNPFLKNLFYANHLLNNHLEICFNKFIYQNHHEKEPTIRINEHLSIFLIKCFLIQRTFINPNFLQTFYLLKKLDKKENFNIIHSAPLNVTSNIHAFKFSRKYHKPFICTPLHHINPFKNSILYPSFQHILKNSEAIIACTLKEKKVYNNIGVKEQKIHIIPPGIDPNEYRNSNIKKFKLKNNIPEDSPLLFFMGRRQQEKGFTQCFYALKYLIKKFKNIYLMIAGPTTREFKLFYKNVPQKIKEHILDLGFLDDQGKTNALASCDVFLLPSLDDAFGIAYLEAWLFKKPVIGASEGNVEGLIDNNINGFLIPFKNIKLLSQKIEELLKDDKKRKEFGQNGYNKLMKNYLLKITNEKMLNLYKEFI